MGFFSFFVRLILPDQSQQLAKSVVSGDLFRNHDLCNPACNVCEPQLSMNIHKSPIIGGKSAFSGIFGGFWKTSQAASM
jgi:hypothetical protein